VLAGLISNEDRSSGTKVPGVGDLPIVGRLFGSQTDSNGRTEILLSITPRIVRAVQRPPASASEFGAGTEASFRRRPDNAVRAQVALPTTGVRTTIPALTPPVTVTTTPVAPPPAQEPATSFSVPPSALPATPQLGSPPSAPPGQPAMLPESAPASTPESAPEAMAQPAAYPPGVSPPVPQR
jgi:general secretion pathway protein D